MKKLSVLAISFIIFAFTPPSSGLSLATNTPGSQSVKNTSGATGHLASAVVAASVNTDINTAEAQLEDYIEDTFDEMDLRGTGLKRELFAKAVIGLQNFKKAKLISPTKSIISIVDFGKASHFKRLWIIDLQSKKLLFQTLVAHGQGSGNERAEVFSDRINSHQSSLGFYVTANTYMGKHGLSLKLNGMDAGYNTSALQRAIVVHGADYVSKDFIKTHGRLGRSHGCPALPVELTPAIINVIKNKSLLYIDGNVNSYTSNYLNKSIAAAYFASGNRTLTASL
ncbi:MAG: hypothetical protein COW65_08505 [Cytophagales bacterium CG18_big_fil_WC_8_21_14_2_50_42_9]|nr:MAG: hypothetical protein COW65_08505 [Cytophagales bacterium CG18_big_fil_WC_8_21_14_2_50_42_9]